MGLDEKAMLDEATKNAQASVQAHLDEVCNDTCRFLVCATCSRVSLFLAQAAVGEARRPR